MENEKTMTNHSKKTRNKQKHNDRNFKSEKDTHIDPEKSKRNIYWTWIRNLPDITPAEMDELKAGTSSPERKKFLELKALSKKEKAAFTFEQAEEMFYDMKFGASFKEKNDRYIAQRHPEKCMSMDDILTSPRFAPTETVFYLGNREDSVPPEVLVKIFYKFANQISKKFPQWHLLDFALHVDEEGAPHIHYRAIISAKDSKGYDVPAQEKGLEQMGVKLPFEDKPRGRKNNRNMNFTGMKRQCLEMYAKEEGITIIDADSLGGMELEDFKRFSDKLNAEIEEKLPEILEKKIQELIKKELAKPETRREINIKAMQKKNQMVENSVNDFIHSDNYFERVSEIIDDKIADEVEKYVNSKEFDEEVKSAKFEILSEHILNTEQAQSANGHEMKLDSYDISLDDLIR